MFKRRLAVPLGLLLAAIAAPASATEEVLYSFTGGVDGSHPDSSLTQGSDGALYGTTQNANGIGEVFKITTAGALTVLHSFSYGSDGYQPSGRMVLAGHGNDLYGGTQSGGANGCGTIFRITPAGAFTKVLDVPCYGAYHTEDQPPALTVGSDGNLYGVLDQGGSYTQGSIFRLTLDGVFTTLYSFTGQGDGAYPGQVNLVEGTDRNFYGLTLGSSSNSCGTAFRVTPQGQLTTIHTFKQDAIGCPLDNGGLVLGDDGNFYGTANVVFSMTPSGTVTIIHSFPSYPFNDGIPTAGLVKASDGAFWGVDSGVFRVTAGGAYEFTYAFASDPSLGDAMYLNMPLVQARDGNFYGTSAYGGAHYAGAIYLINPNNPVTLSPKTAQPLALDSQCEVATVRDASNQPVVGARVDFALTPEFRDPNSGGTATTDAQGSATYCWSSPDSQFERLQVRYGTLTDSARIRWQPHKTTLTAYPAVMQVLNPTQVNLKLSARLMDVSRTPNVPVANEIIDFAEASYELYPGYWIGGTPICWAYTGPDGVASCDAVQFPLQLIQADLGYFAYFISGGVYDGASANGNFLTIGVAGQ